MDPQEILSRDRFFWHPYTPFPHQGPQTVWTRAQGAYVWNSEGKRYLDATSSWWCQVHGHSHPRLVSALKQQAETLDHVMVAPHTHGPAAELSVRLVEKLGAPFSKVFFSDDGSTAVETALKMALQLARLENNPNKTRFLSLKHGYHGDTLGAVSVSAVSEFQTAFSGSVPAAFRAEAPYCYRCPLKKEYPSCQIACLDEVEAILKKHSGEIAAGIIEPLVLGAAGMVIYPREYLEGFIRLCHAHGVPVIADEVFTGFGRTGSLFVSAGLSDKPDWVCLSKGLTSGMLPLGATVISKRVAEVFESKRATFYHGHTFTANPLACAVANESLKLFDEEETLGRVAAIQNLFQKKMGEARKLPKVGEARTLGGIFALELVEDKLTKAPPEPMNSLGWKIAEDLWEKGVWIRPLLNVVYLIPPYCTDLSELEGAIELLMEGVSHV